MLSLHVVHRLELLVQEHLMKGCPSICRSSRSCPVQPSRQDLPSFVMSMTSAVVPSDFFIFDFEADFGELVVFKPQAPHRGIPMANASQLDVR